MRVLARALLALLLVAPASVGATRARPSVALTASPAHVMLQGTGRATVRVTNSGKSRVVLDIRRAGFALDLRGRPEILAGSHRSANAWLAIRPRQLALRPGRSTALTISARVPHGAEPGDHDALVLLTSRPRRHAGLAVRMRLGVHVVVRAPGRIVRRLVLRRLAVRRQGQTRILELVVGNRGNVTEEIERERISLSLRRGRALVRLRPEPRELLPHSRGVVQFRYRGRMTGWVDALASIAPASGGSSIYRSFRIRL